MARSVRSVRERVHCIMVHGMTQSQSRDALTRQEVALLPLQKTKILEGRTNVIPPNFPNEDLGRIDKRGNPDFDGSTFQGREYYIWIRCQWLGTHSRRSSPVSGCFGSLVEEDRRARHALQRKSYCAGQRRRR